VVKRNCLVSTTKRKLVNTGELRGVRCVKVWPIKNIIKQKWGKQPRKPPRKHIENQKRGEQKGKHVRKHIVNQKRGKQKGKTYRKVYNHSEDGASNPENNTGKTYSQSEKGKAKRKVYDKNRLQTDPVYKLHKNLSSGFCNWIKGNRKTCRTEQYVGCTYQELLDHLESQFEEGMTWENQGEWHIDHFKAQSRFDPTIEEEKYKCWHYTNLQPMWSSENISWGNKKKPGDEFVIWMDREIGWVNIEDVINKKTKLNLKIEKEEV